MLGVGVAWACGRLADRRADAIRLAILAGSLAIAVFYAERLLYGTSATWWIALLGALGAIALAALARFPGTPSPQRTSLAGAGATVLTLVAILAVPFGADVTAIETHVTDAGYVGALPTEQQRPLSAYLRAHQGRARYELAAESSTAIGSLIVQDARPVLVLTTYSGRVFTSIVKLRLLAAQGQVRYAFLNTFCGRLATSANPACSAPVKWVRAHGADVSLEAGLGKKGLLYRLPGVAP
jgi:hypothetical protein